MAAITETVDRKQPDTPERALNTAFAKAQGEFPSIGKTKTVKVRTNTGGEYTFSYAPLETIIAAVKPVLAKHGLAVTQLLEQVDGRPGLRTELRHSSGGVLGSSFPLPMVPESAQKLGSLLTYLRRYTITAILGIATEDDDDGAQAAGATVAEQPRNTAPPTERVSHERPEGPLLTPQQRNMLFALFTECGFHNRDERLAFAQAMLHRPVPSSNELTVQEASRLIEILQKHRPNEPEQTQVPFGELPEDY